ncbi:MAG: methyltransferase [Microbacteriaceae bacterium]|jgi:hypothetical protein|nr:methyltransferase [Microbacteriaceae bacterium]
MSNDNQQATIEKTWVAYGPAGIVGAIHRVEGGYTFRLLTDDTPRAEYPTLEVAKSALHASLLPGAEWPEFREH